MKQIGRLQMRYVVFIKRDTVIFPMVRSADEKRLCAKFLEIGCII